MAFPGSTFPNSCNQAPLRRFLPMPKRMHAFDGLHMPNGTHVFDRLPYAAQKSIDCPSVHFFSWRGYARAKLKSQKKEKTDFLRSRLSNSEWCPRRESNSHVFRQRFLRPPRLPFRHSGAKSNYTRCSRKRKPKFQSTRKKQRCRPRKPSGQARGGAKVRRHSARRRRSKTPPTASPTAQKLASLRF